MKKVRIVLFTITLMILVLIVGIIVIKKSSNFDYELEKIDKYSYFKIYEKGKYGVIDQKGNILISTSYDMIDIPNPTKPVFVCSSSFDEQTGEYKNIKVLNDKAETLFGQFEEVLPIKCETSTSNIPFEKSVLIYKENGKYGIIDFNGEKIINAIYDSIEGLEYREGCLKVRQDNLCGIITIKGKTVIRPKYENIFSDQYYSQEDEYMKAGFIVQIKTDDGYRYGYINKNGKVLVDTEYVELNRFTDIKDDKNIYLLVSKNGRQGIIKNSKTVLKNEYEHIDYNQDKNVFIVQKDAKQGVLTIDGKEIIPISYDSVLCSLSKITTRKGENIEVFDYNGEKQDIKYANIIETSNEDYTISINENNQYGVLNKNGQVLIRNEYENLEYAFDTYFIATKNGKVGVVSTENGEVVDFKYDIIQKVKEKNVLQAIVSNMNLIEMYNNKMEKQLSMNNAILYAFDNYIKLISENNMKYLDNEGNTTLSIKLFSQNKLFSYKDEKGYWGFVDENSNVVVTPQYDLVTEFNKYGYAGIKLENKWGVIDSEGKVIVKPSYDIDWNEPEFINKYCRLNFGYGFEYYTDELIK